MTNDTENSIGSAGNLSECTGAHGKVAKDRKIWIPLEVQQLRLCTSNAGGVGSICGWGTKIGHAMWCGQNLKKKKNFLFNLKGCLKKEKKSSALPILKHKSHKTQFLKHHLQ